MRSWSHIQIKDGHGVKSVEDSGNKTSTERNFWELLYNYCHFKGIIYHMKYFKWVVFDLILYILNNILNCNKLWKLSFKSKETGGFFWLVVSAFWTVGTFRFLFILQSCKQTHMSTMATFKAPKEVLNILNVVKVALFLTFFCIWFLYITE